MQKVGLLVACITTLEKHGHLFTINVIHDIYIKRNFLGIGTVEPSGLKPDGLAARSRIGAARPVNRPLMLSCTQRN